MNLSTRPTSASALALASAILAACAGGSQTPTPTPATPTSPLFNPLTPAAHPNRDTSWMSPAAQKQPSLLYISNAGSSDVTVYTYLNGGGLLQVGSLGGFSLPTGMCTDKAGDVWIPDYGTGKLYEYKHGGTTPIATITQQNGRPYDCTVDPATGNLAVTNQLPDGRYSYGNVKVYPKGSKRGTTYIPPYGFASVDFLAYDNRGNLFADGAQLYGQPALFELPKGSAQLAQITLNGATLDEPGAINWISPTLLVGDQNYQNQGAPGAYRIFITASVATVVGGVTFPSTQNAYGFWRRAGKIVVPDHTGNIVRIYTFPGGILTSKLTTGISLPFGATVSQLAGPG